MKNEILAYIPQRPPFVFVDALEEVDTGMARTRFTIPADCPLVSDGVLPIAGLMENVAQTCAARMGHEAGNKIGFIGAVKAMEARRLPRVGETLTTEVRLIQEVMNISLMECTTRVENDIIATTTLKLAIVE